MSLPDHIIGENKYGRFCVPKSSSARPAARAILAGRVWEQGTIRFVANNCGNGDIVHAGTFFGDFLPGLSKALQPGARLWAFEPSRENFLCAQQTIALNSLTNVILTNAGLGARQGSGSLCISLDGEAHGGASRLVEQEAAGEAYESVPIVALDEVIPHDRHISVLQLDVEEYEQQALEGALGLMKRCRPLVVLETLPKSPEWHEQNILSLGYREIGEVHHNHVLAMPDVDRRVVEKLHAMNDRWTERRAKRRAAKAAVDEEDSED
ncbi:MAG TPA: FkbM family methyltransferase [Rhizomicrobium sp.]|nr:FkbM family methyltransferase [Rhizomicrobium sp.]